MNIYKQQNIQDERIRLLDELESVLKQKLELAHQGDATGEKFAELTARAESLTQQIKPFNIEDSDELRIRYNRLRKLYKALCLVVAAEKADVCEDLARIRRGRKVVGTYRHTV